MSNSASGSFQAGNATPTQAATRISVNQAPNGSTPPNAYEQSAGNLSQARNLAAGVGSYQPMQLAGASLQAYQNPYTRNVIDNSMADLNRARQMAVNDTGASATAAGAFGGSRHGVAEALTNTGFANQAASMASGLRQAGFQNAQQAREFDINTGLANQGLRLSASSALSGIGQQRFDMANTINATQAGYGNQQQANAQNLINSIYGQWQGYTGQAGQNLALAGGTIGGLPHGQSGTTRNNPGLMDYLTFGLSL